MSDAYKVVVDNQGCVRCGEGKTWTVEGPDGICIGQSWGGPEGETEAEEWAGLLNLVFEKGQATRADGGGRMLKPCPFCGSDKVRVMYYWGTECRVNCYNCNTDGPKKNVTQEHEAIEAWNTRTDGVVEALKECIEALSVLSDSGTGPGCYAYHRAKKALAAVGGE